MAEDKNTLDPDADPYWEGAAKGVLRYRRCTNCSIAIFYPRSICPNCGATDPKWAVSEGAGVVYACTTVHRAPPAFAERAPYTVLLVDLDEGFRMMGGLLSEPCETTVVVGDRVTVTFTDGPDGRPAPYFKPV
ncbi:MAG: hypothetical protein CL573_04550 [Alphaproteobacteria bacterium]|nr:hypothetical protein [Alphaproteobacteria bacterium]HCP00886.1 hypothetical protein [Rhodospirillaceae bacterium]